MSVEVTHHQGKYSTRNTTGFSFKYFVKNKHWNKAVLLWINNFEFFTWSFYSRRSEDSLLMDTSKVLSSKSYISFVTWQVEHAGIGCLYRPLPSWRYVVMVHCPRNIRPCFPPRLLRRWRWRTTLLLCVCWLLCTPPMPTSTILFWNVSQCQTLTTSNFKLKLHLSFFTSDGESTNGISSFILKDSNHGGTYPFYHGSSLPLSFSFNSFTCSIFVFFFFWIFWYPNVGKFTMT